MRHGAIEPSLEYLADRGNRVIPAMSAFGTRRAEVPAQPADVGYRWNTGQHMLNASFSHFDPTRTSVNLTAYVAPANPAGMVVLVDPFRGADMKRREFITLFGGAGPPQCRGERV